MHRQIESLTRIKFRPVAICAIAASFTCASPLIADVVSIGDVTTDSYGVLIVGNNSDAGALVVNNGSTLNSSAGSVIGGEQDVARGGVIEGSSGSVAVSDASWNVGAVLWVGDSGTGQVAITNGSTLTSGYASTDSLGEVLSASGTSIGIGLGVGSMTIDNSTWVNYAGVWVGNDGWGNVTASNGSIVTDTGNCIIGKPYGQSGTTTGNITVEGSSWTETNDGDMDVGDNGIGTLNITVDGKVSNYNGAVGARPGSSGQTTVDGKGSIWTNVAFLAVGLYGGHGTLNVTNGGQVIDGLDGQIGFDAGSVGVVSVDGAGSSLTNNISLMVGGTGNGGGGGNGTLNITNGGEVSDTTGNAYVGDTAGSVGLINVDGAGSILSAGMNLDVGNGGQGSLRVTNGGQVIMSQNGYIGYSTNSVGEATIDGSGSEWGNSLGDIEVGYYGAGSLTVSGGGTVDYSNGGIGVEPGATGNVIIEGSGSSITINGGLTIGDQGSGVLAIKNGASMTIASTVAIGQSAGTSGSVSVDGTGSTWTTNGGSPFAVGGAGQGTLSVTNGGVVNNASTGQIGFTIGSTGAVIIDGNGSSWINRISTVVGEQGSGSLTITNGGQVIDTDGNGYVGDASGSNGHVSVDGIGSNWHAGINLTIGNGGNGALDVTNGGVVNIQNGYVGNQSGANGYATVDGAGSAWIASGELNVGIDGVGTLNISNNGVVQVNGGLVIAQDSGSSGTINLEGGTLNIEGNRITTGNGTATFQFKSGTLQDLSDVDLDLHQQGGILVPGSMTIRGYTTINGNYTQDAQATLQMSIAGNIPSQYDQLVVTGNFTNNGALQILLLNQYQPNPGSAFGLIYAGSITGMFSAVDLPTLRPFLYWVTEDLDTTGTLYVTYPGDANLDGVVNGADVAMITPNGNSWSTGDFNGDGKVNGDDWALYMLGVSLQGTYATAIPEPSFIGMFMIALIFAPFRRSRWRLNYG